MLDTPQAMPKELNIRTVVKQRALHVFVTAVLVDKDARLHRTVIKSMKTYFSTMKTKQKTGTRKNVLS